jgi:uncharacterized SAM-binding protein YcdF (DUF218 family)
MYTLSKALPLLFLPVSITLLLLLGGIFLRRKALLIAAGIVLWCFSSPIVGDQLVRMIEGNAVRLSPESVTPADAIVVLSNGRVTAPGPAAVSEWSDADRFFAGVELHKVAKAPLLIFTGGSTPFEPGAPLEGTVLSEYAVALGVPAGAILVTTRVFNTAEEAQAVSALMREQRLAGPRILLVTSAFHMPRAARLFTRAGFTVAPYPVDFSGAATRRPALTDLLPNANALSDSQGAIRELYGRLYYWVIAR